MTGTLTGTDLNMRNVASFGAVDRPKFRFIPVGATTRFDCVNVDGSAFSRMHFGALDYWWESNGGSIANMSASGDFTCVGSIKSGPGPNAALWFYDRTDYARQFAWYATGARAILNLGGVGDLMSVTTGGALSTIGGFDFGSSRKLKDIDGPMPYGLAAVERMELAAGHYKPEYNGDGRRRLFFVAEQLAELVPEAVDLEGVEFNGERVPSIKLDQLLPVMAKAIQELAAEVRAVKEGR